MVVNKRKKVTRYRAHTTHGGGHRKKRRGAGNRGGKGNAGTGKRGKAKKPSYEPLGKKGFLPPGQQKDYKPVINLSSISNLIEKKQIKEEKGIYSVNLTELGYRKLLGTGNTNLKLNITVSEFSKQVEQKIKDKGGNIQSPKKKSVEKIEE